MHSTYCPMCFLLSNLTERVLEPSHVAMKFVDQSCVHPPFINVIRTFLMQNRYTWICKACSLSIHKSRKKMKFPMHNAILYIASGGCISCPAHINKCIDSLLHISPPNPILNLSGLGVRKILSALSIFRSRSFPMNCTVVARLLRVTFGCHEQDTGTARISQMECEWQAAIH